MKHVKTLSGYLIYLMLLSVLLLIVIEISIRGLFPQINFQGNQKSLFVENKYQNTMGLKSNSTGVFFGKVITTDEFGFRQMQSPSTYQKSWLFLGDSVTFGVSIDSDKIFSQQIQNAYSDIKIWNTAVVGYSALDYLNVLDGFIKDREDIDKVVLFFCLNDVYGNLKLNPEHASIQERVLSFLRSYSKLFLYLKKQFFDRSKSYAMNDIALYQKGNKKISKHLNTLVKIKSKLEALNIDFVVVILPYEYQLREQGHTSPQTFLSSFFDKNNITSLDLYNDFTALNSEAYFLYGDPMHLSEQGHKVVANKMLQYFKKNRVE